MKPGDVMRKLGGINPLRGVWETPWFMCMLRTMLLNKIHNRVLTHSAFY